MDRRAAPRAGDRVWEHAPEAGEDGYTAYERGSVRLELAFLARDDDPAVAAKDRADVEVLARLAR